MIKLTTTQLSCLKALSIRLRHRGLTAEKDLEVVLPKSSARSLVLAGVVDYATVGGERIVYEKIAWGEKAGQDAVVLIAQRGVDLLAAKPWRVVERSRSDA